MSIYSDDFQTWIENRRHVLMWLLWQMPLLRQGEIAVISGIARDRVSKLLKVLAEDDLVAAGSLGRRGGVVKRYALTAAGARFVSDQLGIPVSWQMSGLGLRWAIRRLAMYEAFYAVIRALLEGEELVEFGGIINEPPDPTAEPVRFSRDVRIVHFQWLQRGPIDAVVRFANGAWMPMVWLGSTHTHHSVLAKMQDAMRRLGTQRPVGWVIVGADRLATTLGAQAWGDGPTLAVSADGFVERRMKPGPLSFSPPREQSSPARLGSPEGAFRWAEGNRTIQGLNGAVQHEMLRYILDWTGATPRQLQTRFGGSARRGYGTLVKHELIVKLDGGFYLTAAGMLAVAQEDRVSHQRVSGRLGVYLVEDGGYREGQQRHNRILVDVEQKLHDEDVAVFGGHRGLRYFPRREDETGDRLGAAEISPDAVLCVDGERDYTVLLHLELELAPRPPAAIQRKLLVYDRAQRHLWEPILSAWVFEGEGSAAAAQGVCQEASILTSTLSNFLTGDYWGCDSVWTVDGMVNDPDARVPLDYLRWLTEVHVSRDRIAAYGRYLVDDTADIEDEVLAVFDRIPPIR